MATWHCLRYCCNDKMTMRALQQFSHCDSDRDVVGVSTPDTNLSDAAELDSGVGCW